LASGEVSVSRLRPVSIEDLLGREPISLESKAICETFHGQVVMVTVAGGSIGSELRRQIAAYGPGRLLLLHQSEV
jgi:FlaA1/EpsC-like NDP-sugar epimerase